MNKQVKYTYSGMRQDTSNSKFNNEFYFEGMNIRILATNNQSSGSITNTKGNEFLLQIPIPVINNIDKTITYNDVVLPYTNTEIDSLVNSSLSQIIIGNCRTKNGFVIFSTNNSGLDCIWFLEENDLTIRLLYIRNLNFNTNSPIQALNNYENSKIDKVYWVDGKEQLRVINIYHSLENEDLEELIDLSESLISIVSDINFSNVNIESVSYGGSHTAGMIQYAYSYYKINGSESIISPLSNLIPLGKSVIQGGNLNEIVGTIPKIVIENLDDRFTNLKLYAIKYTSLNALPSINVIADRSIFGLSSFTYYDDGKVLYPATIEDIALDFNKIIVPKHIESKNNRLFAFNYKDKFYKLTQQKNNLDCRAYAFPINNSNTTVFNNVTGYNEGTDTVLGTTTAINYTTNILNPNFLTYNNPSINGQYLVNKYQPNSAILGGEGYFLKYEIIRTIVNSNSVYDYRFFKDNELYRIAIQFYNKYGIKSTPNWIADFIVTSDTTENNLSGNYAGIKLTLKPEFFVWLNTQSNFLDDDGNYDDFLKPVGFKLVRGNRTINDKSIIDQGIINGMMACSSEKGFVDLPSEISRANSSIKIPSLMRRFDNYLCPMYQNNTYTRVDSYSNHPELAPYADRSGSPGSEAYSPTLDPLVDGGDVDDSQRTSIYQFNKLMQFYSPGILFNRINNIESNKCRVVGGIINNDNSLKAKKENWQSATFSEDALYAGVISPFDVKSTNIIYDYNPLNGEGLMARGIYGPGKIHQNTERKETFTYQFFRNYSGDFIMNQENIVYDIYGTPEIVESDQTTTKYNNDSKLTYVNNMNALSSNLAGADDLSNTDNVIIESILTKGSRCSIFALGEDDDDVTDRKNIEDLFVDSNFSVINSTPVYPDRKIYVHHIVNTIADVVFPFTDEYVGVLDSNEVYYNNDLVNVVDFFNSQNVNFIFTDLTDYVATATIANNNSIIAFSDGIDTDYYMVDDYSTGLSGITLLGSDFNYRVPTGVNEVNKYINSFSEISSINTFTIYTGYKVCAKDTNIIYEYNGTSGDPISTRWDNIGTITLLPPLNVDGGLGIILEYVNDTKLFYVGSYYGGNSYESKTKTVYVEASDYYSLNPLVTQYIINDPGDTFVQEYSILRLGKQEAVPYSSAFIRLSEIVKVRLESEINQNKRNDLSIDEPNSIWQPSQGDYHSYNTVYSQSPNLITSQDISYEVKQNELYDVGIIASGFKRPGEIIDNWTNFNILDTMNLEGKYGSINAVVKHKDEIITFQDNAIAQISINPRVQIQGDDGVAIKLGTGNLLDRYTYINTNSGTLNKWGVISTNSGIFYYDTINNSLNILSNDSKLSDLKHLHSFFQKNINSNIIKEDNHILRNGIQFGYDYLNNDIYFTFLQGQNSKTINFNELQNEFVSLHGFKPSFYFNKGKIFLTTESSNTELYNHLEGIYNTYYGEESPSYIIYNLNPEPDDVETVFDNIEFKSELYLNGVDIPNQTITDIQCYNEYQDSGLVPLVNRRNGNLRRKFRDWNAFIPREGRFRIRGPYSKLKLEFKNDNNKKLILHDMIVSYTT